MQRALFCLLSLCLVSAACNPTQRTVRPQAPEDVARAESALQSGDNAAAAAQFRAYLAGAPDPAYRARAYEQLAEAEYNLGNYQAAIDVLTTLETEYPAQHSTSVAVLRGNAEYAAGNRADAFLHWEDAWAGGTPAERPTIQTRIQDAAANLSDAETRELDELLTAPAVREMVATRVRHAAPVVAVAETAAPLRPTPADTSAAPAVAPLHPVPAETSVASTAPPVIEASVPDGARVACILPLTSPDRPYATRVLTGLRLAFRDTPRSLVVRDSGGDPETARKILTELAADPSIIAVIGPLRSSETTAVAPVAERLHMPLILLSQGDGITGRYVVQSAMTRGQEVRLLVAHAMSTQRARRFAVLFPDDAYGQSFAELFRDEVSWRGGTLVGTSAYEPGQGDFSAEAAMVERWSRQREIDAIFIPDGAGVAAVLAATIRSRLPDVILLGTDGWNRPATVAEVGIGIEGALFPDAFFAGSKRAGAQTFLQRFQQQANRPPTVFEAQAYDAGLLVRQALASGAVNRDELLTQVLQAGSTFDGAGRLRAGASGLERELVLLHVRDGAIEEVTGHGAGD